MRELATLLLIVLLVYLFQCLCWAGTRGHAISLELSGRSGRRKRGFPWSSLDLTGYWVSVVTDVTSNGELVAGDAELEPSEAGLKFRGPETGDSELRVEIRAEGCREAILSVHGEKTGKGEEWSAS